LEELIMGAGDINNMHASSCNNCRPTMNGVFRGYHINNSSSYDGGNGSIASEDIRAARQMQADLNRLICSLSALVEDVREALRVASDKS
jgi:hypothetical protein